MMITSPLDGNKQNKIFLYGNVLNNGIEKKNGSELSDNLSDTQFFAFENIDKKKLTAEKNLS